MVGAKSKEEFDSVRPFLECMGKNVIHAGEIGHGLVSISSFKNSKKILIFSSIGCKNM